MKKMIDSGSIAKITKEERVFKNKESILQLQRENAIPPTTITPSDNNNSTPQVIARNDRYRRRILVRDKEDEHDVLFTGHWREADTNIDSNPSSTRTTDHSNRNTKAPPPGKAKSTSYSLKFVDKIMEHAEKYRFPYKKLKWKNRIAHIDNICSLIIAACLDKKEMKARGGLEEMIVNNEILANECMTIVNSLKERLSLKLMVDLPNDGEEIDPVPLVEGDEDCPSEEFDYEKAYAILGETTGRGYDRIRSKLCEQNLPSLYYIEKNMPIKIESVEFDTNNDDSISNDVDSDFWDTLYGPGTSKFVVKDEFHALQLLSNKDDDGDKKSTVIGAKLEGRMDKWIDEVMLKKFSDRGKIVDDGDDLILLNCFDGAEAIKTEKELKGVISFSSQLLPPKLVQNGTVQAGSSFNILTWMQLLAKEELHVLQASMKDYLEIRRELVEGSIKSNLLPNSKLWCYDVHDGKLLYLMAQHSMWNRKNHPFLMCKCTRGRQNFDESHKCSMWSDEEYVEKWNISKTKWDIQTSNTQDWSTKKHKEWCDERNYGITHLGIDPRLLPVSTIRFDSFHLSCAVIRKIMSSIRKLMLKQSSNVIKDFTDNVLRTFMTTYLVWCWNNKVQFSVFKGNDLFLFVSKSEVIIEFLKKRLFQTEEVKGIVIGISKLRPITKFMTMTYIDSEDTFKRSFELFQKDTKELYDAGKSSYLLEDSDETFYFHCLRFYVPQIAKITFERHKLGIGIFTMQGFERRNKESKNVINRFTTMNRRNKNILTNTMKRLLLVFFNEMNAY